MTLEPRTRLGIFALLAVVMAGTRLNHFAPVPDASWAVFFVAGFYLQAQLRWVFPSLMALAVLVDWAVISGSGQAFWSHYCVSPGYWFLLPAHAAMWTGGALLARWSQRDDLHRLGLLALLLPASVALCHLFAQGGFYWLSDVVADPSVAGWARNYSDWLLPYLKTAAMYSAIAAALHLLVARIAAVQPAPGKAI